MIYLRQLVLICFALGEEAEPLPWKVWGWRTISILVTGIGRKNAEKSVRDFLADHTPKLVLTCGFAGGLNPELAGGTVIFSAADHSEMAQKLTAAGARPARFHCAERIATTAAEKQELRRATGADAVEMESEVIHAVCRERGIPCATIRVISDPADEDLPLDFNQFAKPDQSLAYGKLALAIVKSPGKIFALLRLQRRCRFAAGRLAGILAKVILE
jgi:nucleoside phosphorylase